VGAVSLQDIPVVWAIVWNATATFIAIIIISLLHEAFLRVGSLHVARWARGSVHRLFAFCILLGAAVSALFANDGAALILTPIVMSMLLALRFSLQRPWRSSWPPVSLPIRPACRWWCRTW
jgi:arsenical pump membrane protein